MHPGRSALGQVTTYVVSLIRVATIAAIAPAMHPVKGLNGRMTADSFLRAGHHGRDGLVILDLERGGVT